MKELTDKFQKNIVIYIELFIYTTMLFVNVFFAFEIYQKVIEKVAPSTNSSELDVPNLNALNEDLLLIFKEDHQERVSYTETDMIFYDNKWESLENPNSPF